MPNPSLTTAIKEAYASAPVDSVILHTVELRHSYFTQPLRVVLDNRDWTARLEASAPVDGGTFVNFVSYNFNIELPQVEEGSQPELKLVIDNVSQEIQENIAAAAVSDEKVEFTYRPYLSNDVDGSGYLNGPQLDPPLHLVIHHIKADTYNVTAIATFGDMANNVFPNLIYSPDVFPGLIR